MKKRLMPFLLVVLFLSVSLGTALADEIIIKISPDILVLHSGQATGSVCLCTPTLPVIALIQTRQ